MSSKVLIYVKLFENIYNGTHKKVHRKVTLFTKFINTLNVYQNMTNKFMILSTLQQ